MRSNLNIEMHSNSFLHEEQIANMYLYIGNSFFNKFTNMAEFTCLLKNHSRHVPNKFTFISKWAIIFDGGFWVITAKSIVSFSKIKKSKFMFTIFIIINLEFGTIYLIFNGIALFIFRVHNTDDDVGLDGLELYKAIHHAKQHDASQDGMATNDEDLIVASHDKTMGMYVYCTILLLILI